MKGLQILFIIICLCCAFSGCDKADDVKPIPTSSSASTKENITGSDIRGKVPGALMELLEDSYVPKDVDLMQTRYKIGTVEWDVNEDAWIAYGTYTMYEKTGSIYETGSFELEFSEQGYFQRYGSRTYDTYEY